MASLLMLMALLPANFGLVACYAADKQQVQIEFANAGQCACLVSSKEQLASPAKITLQSATHKCNDISLSSSIQLAETHRDLSLKPVPHKSFNAVYIPLPSKDLNIALKIPRYKIDLQSLRNQNNKSFISLKRYIILLV